MKNKELIETKDIITLIDSTPIRINEDWCEKTLRIKGLKVHTVYNLNNNIPVYFDITGAKTEDITEARKIINEDTIKENYTYVFDRGYISSEWWNKINKLKAFFVTRNFKHYSYKLLETRYIHQSYYYCNNNDNNNILEEIKEGDIIQDCIIQSTGEKFKKFYKDKLRMIIVKRDKNKHTTDLKLFTNDFKRTPEEIANLYKQRWQIELFFKWIKQNLKIKKFLSKTENGIKIQICISMIAYVLIKMAQILNIISKKASLKSLIRIINSGIFTRLYRKSSKSSKNTIKPNSIQLQFAFTETG